MDSKMNTDRYYISEEASEEEMKVVLRGLADYNRKFPNGGLDIPTPDISLVLKTPDGKIVGGVITSMLTGVMHLEVLWIEEIYRGRGYGKDLVLEAEKIGRKKGYPASQTWTFSFQAPEFYQSIGYHIVGIFDGYIGGITEYVLLKKLKANKQVNMDGNPREGGFTISEDQSKESMKILHTGLHNYVNEHIGELRKKNPGFKVNLVLKNHEGHIIGGLQAYATLKAIHFVCLWVDEKYRNQGYGRELLMRAEKIAKKKGSISALTNVLSFQSPEFFQKHGYKSFGISDGYPDSIQETFFKKQF
jgi:ribosomal protein S18 acetylase RimI-like enzyme